MKFFFLMLLVTEVFAAPVHLDLELDSSGYRRYLLTQKFKENDHPAIAQALVMGNRLSNWLEIENARRDASRQLRLTSGTTRRGIPIDQPSMYSEKTVAKSLEELQYEMTGFMWDVLNGDPYPDRLPLPDADFIVVARKVDRTYQTAARYKGLMPYLEYYKQAKAKDVRAYYFFKENGWSAEKFEDFDRFSEEVKADLRLKLKDMCLNSGETALGCDRNVKSAERRKQLPKLFSELYVYGEKTWNEFFKIPEEAYRKDIFWRTQDRAEIPFNTPSEDRYTNYLRSNIEDEFRFRAWNLRLRFGEFPASARLEFRTGTVPHVDRLGGNLIVMDTNQSIEEYESQWIIRHEFGHVLGLPDCYHEFYDVNLGAFVNYQLDTTDLMCSRAGNMNERIFLELEKAYFKP